MRERGGVRVDIPARARPGHWLTDLLGQETADTICRHLAVQGVKGVRHEIIPLGAGSTSRQARRAVAKALAKGVPVRKAALDAGVHERTAWRVKSRMDGRDDAQADLFERSGRSPTPVARRLDGPAWVEADPLEIELLILNLLKNAADATAGEALPAIELRLARRGQRWWLGVADNGPALDDVQMAGLFTPLNTKKPDGLGLGLAIAARIAEAHGGRLDARRRLPQGLEVGFDLPALEDRDG